MIVRIAEEGQYRLDDDVQARINELDDALEAALDTEGFAAALGRLLDAVRTLGQPVADEELVGSNIVLPPADATAEEVKAMLTDEGLILLSTFANLHHLDLGGTRVTDEGLARLKSLKGLGELELSGIRVTSEGVADLKSAIPDLKVTFN